MAAFRKVLSPSSLVLVAIGVAAAAIGVLLDFPESPLVWEIATWTLVAGLLALVVLVLLLAFTLATRPAARTWPRITSFLIGLGCLAGIAVVVVL